MDHRHQAHQILYTLRQLVKHTTSAWAAAKTEECEQLAARLEHLLVQTTTARTTAQTLCDWFAQESGDTIPAP